MFQISETPIDVDELHRAVSGPGQGALVDFFGIVRDHARGRKVVELEYHAYKPMAEKKLRQIGSEISEKWGIGDVAIVHRVGRMKVGDTAVVISVASPHRAEAFAACKYAIDRIKQIVPIWKKEYGEDGAEWVEECEVSVEDARAGEGSPRVAAGG
ncbi:MAG: molybdenum cofactor biosynthesis protein MoaE [Nitrospinota bacterium]